ncbi:MAG: hypothetical protein WC128_08735, partial [Bacteroidales bacterium]
IPGCPSWARELLARYLLHKISFLNDSSIVSYAKRKSKEQLELPMGVRASSRLGKQIFREWMYYRKIVNLFSDIQYSKERSAKSLFVLSENDIKTQKNDKNPWLSKLYSRDISSDASAIVTTAMTAYDIEEQIADLEEEDIPHIENVFIFHNPKKGKITYSFNVEQINRLNQYGMGIKNIFVFSISERHFRLYYTIDNVKCRLLSELLKKEVKSFDAFDGFISFTQEESDFLFGRQPQRCTYIIDSPERDFFTVELDSFFDQIQHNYRIKNELSLAFTEESQRIFVKILKDEEGYIPSDILSAFFSYYVSIWLSTIIPAIEKFISDSHSIAFILPKACDWAKAQLKMYFSRDGRRIDLKFIDDLKDGIKVDKIIFLIYRYTDKIYKSYPNSFDPLPISQGQQSLTIINRLTHNKYYEWNKHFYDRDFNGLLYSDFRRAKLGWKKCVYQRPLTPKIWSNIEEAEVDERHYEADKCTVIYSSGKEKEYFASTKVLFIDNEQKYRISQLKDISESEIKQILVLDELVEMIRESLLSKTKDNPQAEDFIRKDPKYGLSDDEIKSSIELWKYLLLREVNNKGLKTVYQEIFLANPEISLNGFSRWVDMDYPMILPRSRSSQNALLTYLGFSIGSPYHRIILTKKLLNINYSRTLNSQIESLLQSLLTKPLETKEDYGRLCENNSDILTILEVNNVVDANALKDLLEIKLKSINNIIYDQD